MEKQKSRKVLIRITVIVFIFLIVCTLLSRTIYTATLPRVTAANPQTMVEVPISTNTRGEVTFDVTPVQYDTDLKVIKVDVTPGRWVQTGDVLLEVDASAFQIQIKEMELAILQLEDQLDDTYSSDLREQLNLQLEIAEDQLALYKSTIPFDGVITAACEGNISQIYVKEGQSVPAGTPLLDFIKQGVTPRVQFTLPQDIAAPYKLGSKVNLTYSKIELENGVEVEKSVREEVTVTDKAYKDGAFVFYTDIDKAGSAAPYAGMKVDVEAIASSNAHSLVIPLSAISESSNGSLSIYVLQTRDGLFGQETYVEQMGIKELEKNNINAAIYGEGINQFLQVVDSTSRPLSDGEVVKVEK